MVCAGVVNESIKAPEQERENLLALAQVMAQMRYNDRGLFSILRSKDRCLTNPPSFRKSWKRRA